LIIRFGDFGGFTKIIDDLGGVTVQVPVTFDDPFYPITGQENNTCGITEDQINALKAKYSGYQLETQFTCRYEHLHFDKGPANLDGSTALKFVRSRHGDSDFARSLRQFAVLIGVENKLISLKSLGKLDDTINTLSAIVKTDLTAGTIKTLLNVFGDPGKYKINQIQLTNANVLNEGTSSDGQYILTPKAGIFDFSGIKSLLQPIYKISPAKCRRPAWYRLLQPFPLLLLKFFRKACSIAPVLRTFKMVYLPRQLNSAGNRINFFK